MKCQLIMTVFLILSSLNASALSFYCEDRLLKNGVHREESDVVYIKVDKSQSFKEMDIKISGNEFEFHQYRNGVYVINDKGYDLGSFRLRLKNYFKGENFNEYINFSMSLFNGKVSITPLVWVGESELTDLTLRPLLPGEPKDKSYTLPKSARVYESSGKYVEINENYGVPNRLITSLKSAFIMNSFLCRRDDRSQKFKKLKITKRELPPFANEVFFYSFFKIKDPSDYSFKDLCRDLKEFKFKKESFLKSLKEFPYRYASKELIRNGEKAFNENFASLEKGGRECLD